MNSFVVFATLVATCLAVGPTVPYGEFQPSDCTTANHMVVDAENMCWYHQCILLREEDGGHRLLPRRCALGSRVSYNFIDGVTNPCTVNFDSVDGYDCERTQASVDGPPECFESTVCENGGTAVYESNRCWCICPVTWQGEFDCSKPTRDVTDLPPGSDICVDGEPLDDWCGLADGCLNGGTCFNQCNDFWCKCPNHEGNDYWGKRCEDRPEDE